MWSESNKQKRASIMKFNKFILLFLIILFYLPKYTNTNEELYKKIDLFGEVLEKIKKEYVDDVDQSEMIDSAINGALQSLDPYSAYMNPELFESMQTDTRGNLEVLELKLQWKQVL